ncbi:unnamed protein product [Rotaria sordida]|uniref:Ubiquitin carboxyl-terminal hydrolase n=1 Tax=Rotaria sordida TaxID=392033 RepID=A0A815M904_9BILA|nr:unnamed protein product [Rotaria sordida]CAF1413283.1 unnamed protein product [Rotaria sordida]
MMPSNLVERYKELLAKEPKIDDKYVVIDIKWLKHWKRFVGIDKSDEEQVTEPGPIDFTTLIDPATVNSFNEIQLRSDAVEGNDYTFIPYDLYRELKQTYTKIGPEIIRRVIPQGQFQTIIEVFLVPLRLRESKDDNANIKQIYRSRRTKIEEIKQDIHNEFCIPRRLNYQLYSSVDENGQKWEPIDDEPNLTLEDISLTKNAFIIYEDRTLSLEIDSLSKTEFTRGLCGLSNLGNTCFMNSALQCLSNVPELTEYFCNDEYREHINPDNPLGMKGDVAIAYGKLIHEMWSGNTDYYAPKFLKQSVANYAPQFSGYSQQDSQEFMSFLLDGLHEDLNRIKIKPYVEKKDDNGTIDDVTLANQQWEYYQKRNQSKIQDIFYGQIKSLVQCLTCGTRARTFDPICFLSLPLPIKANIRQFKIDYVRLNGQIKTYHIKYNENDHVRNLVQKFCDCFQEKKTKIHDNKPIMIDIASESNETTNQDEDEDEDEDENNEDEDFTKADDYNGHKPKPDHILPVEVYNHRIHLQYRDNTLLTNIFKYDQIVFYETPDSLKKEDSENILIPCIFRDEYHHYNFGLPIYLSVPKHNCKGRNIQEALQKTIGNFLPLPSMDSSDKPFYTASLTFSESYYPKTEPLESLLDDHIDFTHISRTLIIDVASSIVDEYKKREEEKRSEKDPSSPMSSSIQTHSQQKQSTTLLDCFKCFTKKEVLSDDDLWKCPKCNELKKATKKIDLWLLPKVLIVQLKRFNYTRYFRDKIDLFVDCPIRNLDLSQFVLNPDEKPKAKYDLIAVSNHMGYLGGGHYTAHAKNSIDKKWHTFNDSYVSEINEDRIIGDEAYVLIYQQQGQSLPENEYVKK